LLRGILKTDLIKEKINLTDEELKDYRGRLQDLIEYRNQFAHNPIVMSIPSMIPNMKYMKDGKSLNLGLTTEILNQIKEVHKTVIDITLMIFKNLNK